MINRDTAKLIISINDFMGLPVRSCTYYDLEPVSHPLNGAYQLQGMCGHCEVQAFNVNNDYRLSLAFAVVFYGVPTIPDGFVQMYYGKDEDDLVRLINPDHCKPKGAKKCV